MINNNIDRLLDPTFNTRFCYIVTGRGFHIILFVVAYSDVTYCCVVSLGILHHNFKLYLSLHHSIISTWWSHVHLFLCLDDLSSIMLISLDCRHRDIMHHYEMLYNVLRSIVCIDCHS